MTKKELIEMINDDDDMSDIYAFTRDIAICLFGSESKTEKVYDSKTQKYKPVTHEMTLMEVLVSINDALWTIAENM